MSGDWLQRNMIKNFNFITKIPKISNTNQKPKNYIKLTLEKSLQKLKTNKLYGLLFRSPGCLIKEPYFSFWNEAKNLKNASEACFDMSSHINSTIQRFLSIRIFLKDFN